MRVPKVLIVVIVFMSAMVGFAADDTPTPAAPDCSAVPTATQLKSYLQSSTSTDVGGLFQGSRMWGAVVNRDGVLCAVATSQSDPKQVWPGSQAIAKAKAYTANAFSLDNLALSTARLYTFTQPGHSLNSLGQSNPFDPKFLAAPGAATSANGTNNITGGMIFFGGGLPLYKDGKIVGGLGVSGDTSCADHEIAKRVRAAASLIPPGGNLVDDIVFREDGQQLGAFTHPHCINTYRNGEQIKPDEGAAAY